MVSILNVSENPQERTRVLQPTEPRDTTFAAFVSPGNVNPAARAASSLEFKTKLASFLSTCIRGLDGTCFLSNSSARFADLSDMKLLDDSHSWRSRIKLRFVKMSARWSSDTVQW